MHRWSNDTLCRYIYLLAFDGKRVYVGQSVNPTRRIKVHRREWDLSFLPLIVSKLETDEAGILELEYAWRWRAPVSGWIPITLKGDAFDLSLVRESTRLHGEGLTWLFTI